jgi:hypothetical protein
MVSQAVSTTPDANFPSSMPPFAFPLLAGALVDDMSTTHQAVSQKAFADRA